MGKRKPFIDKKNAITFRLVHRSQRDPLQASEDAPLRVLVQTTEEKKVAEKQREEQQKFGVFFDDDYDYMQHLYDLNEVRTVAPENMFDGIQIFDDDHSKAKPSLQLPSSVFPSTVEMEVGMLNRAVPVTGPQPSWDPDIVAAMDDDFDMDNPGNVLEDDFIAKANAEPDDGSDHSVNDDVDSIGSNDWSDDEVESVDCHRERTFAGEETKSHFTNYSMTSSVIRRNEGLTLLDDRFEKLFEEYSDGEIGALEHDDIDGCVTHEDPLMQDALADFEVYKKKRECESVIGATKEKELLEDDDSFGESDSDETVEKIVIEKIDEKWDCESILSTYSNLYNHPTVIHEPSSDKKIKLTARLGIPRDTLPPPGLTQKQIEKQMREERWADRASTYRPSDESPEERKARKQALKSERKERRIEKKSNKLAFKDEEKRQKKEYISLITNVQATRIT